VNRKMIYRVGFYQCCVILILFLLVFPLSTVPGAQLNSNEEGGPYKISFSATTNRTSETVFAEINIRGNNTNFNESYFYGPYSIYENENNTHQIPFYSPEEDNYTITKKIYNQAWELKSQNVTYKQMNKITSTPYSEVYLKDIDFQRADISGDNILDNVEVSWNISADSEDRVNTSFLLYGDKGELIEYIEIGPYDVNESVEFFDQTSISDLPKGEYKLEILLVNETYQIKDSTRFSFELNHIVKFTGEYHHEEVYNDSGDLIDKIRFHANVNSSFKDEYVLSGYITSENGDVVKEFSEEIYLNKGENNISFEVPGEEIYKQKINGRLEIEFLGVFEDREELYSVFQPYRTSDYHYTDFTRPKVYFTGDFRSFPIDENERGLYENLSFEMEVEANSSLNNLTLSSDILDENGSKIKTLQGQTLVEPGTNWISLEMSGTTLSEMEYEGTFELSYPSIEHLRTTFDIWKDPFTTQSYDYQDFAIPETELLSIEDQGVDVDGSGLYDHLRVTAEVNIHEEDEYYIETSLESMFGSDIDSVQFEKELGRRKQVIEIDFEGSKIYEFGGSDTIFYIDLALSRDGEPLIEEDRISTEEYHYEDFERPSVQVREVIQDEAKDTDGDGNFNELIFTIEFEVKEDGEGTHHIHSTLLDSQGIEEITSSVQEVSLSKGEDEVELSFAGKEIFSSREDGFILGTVSVYREDEIVVQESLNYHTSEDYSWEEFEPSKAYIVDVEENVETPNEEGEHPSLTFNVTVEVTDEGQGEYSIHLSLYTTEGYYITEETVTKELSEGTEVVQVKVSGEVFTTKQRDGPYEIRSLIIEHEDTNIDELREAHTTETYEWRDFEEVEDVDPLEVDDDSVFKGESLIYLISAISMIAAVAILVYYRKKVS